MFEKNAEFLVEPVAIEYIKLPDGQNDIWLRKNIVKTTVDTSNNPSLFIFKKPQIASFSNRK